MSGVKMYDCDMITTKTSELFLEIQIETHYFSENTFFLL